MNTEKWISDLEQRGLQREIAFEKWFGNAKMAFGIIIGFAFGMLASTFL